MRKTYLLTLLCLVTIYLQAQGPIPRMEAKLDQVESTYGLTGEGVLTVMMDRGIDYRHPDFIDESGNTRILYIYDLYDDTGKDDADNPFGVGTIYDEDEINAALQSGNATIPTDVFGHGTATTGIMAGNGSAASNSAPFKGVATKSKIISIIVTKDGLPAFGNNPGRVGQFDPNILPTAFDFASEKISELGIPSVTLLNIGSIGDPTDGSIAFCDDVKEFVEAGNTFVCGVGDDGGNDNHAIKTLQNGTDTEFVIEKGETGFLRFTAWYSEDDRSQVRIERPNGQIEGPFNAPAGPNGAVDNTLNDIRIFHRGANVEFSSSSANLRQILIDFTGAAGTYKVILSPTQVNSDGKINAMLNPSRYNNTNRFTNNDTPGGSINSYSSCPYTLSPGDYVATNNYVDINNVTRTRSGEGAPGQIWAGSSTGSTMDGRLGIDLVAPGEIAAAAYSQDSFYGNFDFNVLQNSGGNYGIQTAVSAAAPIVTGVIALMLEVNPNLTPEEIKTILQETARSDNFTGETPNATWGHGKLDALAAINETFQTVNIDDFVSGGIKVNIFPNPFTDEIILSIEDENIKEVHYELFSLMGQKIIEGNYQQNQKLDLSELASGVYMLLVETEEGAIAKKIVKGKK